MFNTVVFVEIILIITLDLMVAGESHVNEVQNVTSLGELIKKSNGNPSALYIDCINCGQCNRSVEQYKMNCHNKTNKIECYSAILADKETIDKQFKNLSVEWTPYLVFFIKGTEVCSLKRECDPGDNNYISSGFGECANYTKSTG